MSRSFPSFYSKIKAVILLFCILCMMVSNCPVRSLLTNASSSTEQAFNQHNGNKVIVSNGFSCSFDGEIVQATFDYSKTVHSSVPIPFILILVNLYFFTFILNSRNRLITKYQNLAVIYSIPLFLKNRSIII